MSRNRGSTIKGVALVLTLATLGYVTFDVTRHVPASTASPDFAPGNQTAKPEAAATTNTDAQRKFDYFPDHYVNQATKDEEPAPTF